jgi:hypothetical protein
VQARVTQNLTLVAALTAAPAAFAGSTSSYLLDLKSLKTETGLATDDIYGAASAVVPAPEAGRVSAWSAGVSGPVSISYFTLTPENVTDRAPTESIKVDWGSGGAKVQQCAPGTSACIDKQVVHGGDYWRFTAEGIDWALKINGNPCANDGACSFMFPTWALELRRRSGGSLNAAPQVATVVAHRLGITVMDAQRGGIWANVAFDGDGAPALSAGGLRQARFLSPTLLQVEFVASTVFLDFASDRLFALVDGKLWVNEGGLLAPQALKPVSLRTERAPGRLLLATATHLITENVTVEWDSGADNAKAIVRESKANPVALAVARVTESGTFLVPTAASYAAGRVTVWSMGLSGDWAEAWSRVAQATGADDLSFNSSGDVFVASTRTVLTADIPAPGKVLFNGASDNVALANGDHAFATTQAGKSCGWSHLASKSGTVFSPSGLSGGCNEPTVFQVDGDNVSVSTLDTSKAGDVKVSVKVLRQ